MANTRLAIRYAKALLDLAVETNQVDAVFTDVQWLQAVCKESRDFVNMLRSPVIHEDKKKKIVQAVVKDNISDLTKRFVDLLITKTREADLPEITTAFITQYKAYKNIQTVKLTTAVPVSDEVKNHIIDQVKKVSDITNIELEETVDPNIIGGFVLEVGDKMVDASIAYDLRAIAKQFRNNDFIYKVR